MSAQDVCLRCGRAGHCSASCRRGFPGRQEGIATLLLLKVLGGLAIAAAVAGAVAAFVHQQREIGRAEIRAEWAAAELADSQANAKETLRRLEAQQRNQELQNAELATARAAADRNARAAERMRREHEEAADIWGNTLRNSPSAADLEAAGAAIRVCTDLLGRADRRAGILAAYSDAARTAGLKCERDYDSLEVKP